MNRPGPNLNLAAYEPLRASGRTLARTAPWVRFGFLAIGASLAMDQLGPLVSDMQLTWAERRIAGRDRPDLSGRVRAGGMDRREAPGDLGAA